MIKLLLYIDSNSSIQLKKIIIRKDVVYSKINQASNTILAISGLKQLSDVFKKIPSFKFELSSRLSISSALVTFNTDHS